MNEEKYIKGFNSGYILASHKPELLQVVTENLAPNNDYVIGLIKGREQLEQEKTNEQLQLMSNIRSRLSSERDRN